MRTGYMAAPASSLLAVVFSRTVSMSWGGDDYQHTPCQACTYLMTEMIFEAIRLCVSLR